MTASSFRDGMLAASVGILMLSSAAESQMGAMNEARNGGTQGLQEQMYENRMKGVQEIPISQEGKKPQGRGDGASSGSVGGQQSQGGTPGEGTGSPKSSSNTEMGGAGSHQSEPPTSPPSR